MAYEVVKELQIPEEAHHQPIPVEVLPFFGISEDAPQANLLLAQVALNGAKINGNTWSVAAFDAVNPPQPGRENEMYGGIFIDGEGLTTEEVFGTTEDWIRESETSLWVPGRTIKISESQDTMAGVILVRTADFARSKLVPTPKPASKPGRLRRLLGRR